MSAQEAKGSPNPLGFLCPNCTQTAFCPKHKKIGKKFR